jgi:crotonobetainyl-CoA:carnitine CoA-transferase CaiB-like acyl-CoA transferase
MLPRFQPDFLGGLHGVIAGLAMCLSADEGGAGEPAEVSLLDVMASTHEHSRAC